MEIGWWLRKFSRLESVFKAGARISVEGVGDGWFGRSRRVARFEWFA
jgi:hypothetical protein